MVFGEGNRGNIYNLLRQIATDRFMMVGPGTNKKSMAYVGNVAEALTHGLTLGPGVHIFNYVGTPDLKINELVVLLNQSLGRPSPTRWCIPLPLAMVGGHALDRLAQVTGQAYPISFIRLRKFCENTHFQADQISVSDCKPHVSLQEGLTRTLNVEFLSTECDSQPSTQ